MPGYVGGNLSFGLTDPADVALLRAKAARFLKDYRDAGTLSGLIALWGFLDDGVFLTKSGAVGTAYRLTPPDTECMDDATRNAAASRVARTEASAATSTAAPAKAARAMAASARRRRIASRRSWLT